MVSPPGVERSAGWHHPRRLSKITIMARPQKNIPQQRLRGPLLLLSVSVVGGAYTPALTRACAPASRSGVSFLPSTFTMMCATAESSLFGELPPDVDERALKRRFKELAAVMHPDVNPGSEDANTAFQELTAEYAKLQAACRTTKQRKELEEAWLGLGGLAAATTLVFTTAPIVPAAVAALTGLSRAGNYLSERSPARYAKITREAVEAYVPVEQAAVEADRAAEELVAAEEAALVASLRRAAVAAALEAEAAEEEARTRREAERLAAEAFEPRWQRYTSRVRNALDARLYTRLDRLATWWRKRRRAQWLEKRRLAIEGARALADAAAAEAAAARNLAETRRETAALAAAEAEARATARVEAQRLATIRAAEKAEALQEGEARRKEAALAEATQADLAKVADQVGGLAEGLFGAVGEVFAFSVSAAANGVEQAGKSDMQSKATARERASIVALIDEATAEIAHARAQGNRKAARKAQVSLRTAEKLLRNVQREQEKQRKREEKVR